MIISKKSVVFILISVFFIYISIMLLISFLPSYLGFLGIEPTAITLSMTIIMFTLFIFPPFLGKLSDKIQNRIYFIYLFPVGMVFSLVLLIFTKDIILLNIILFMFGFFISFLTVYLTLFSELVQNDKKWVSYYNSTCAIGNFMGVLIGGILIDFFTIGNIFIFALASFLIAIVFIVFIREDRNLILESNKKEYWNFKNEKLNNPFNKGYKISNSIYYSLFFRSFAIIPIVNVLVNILSPHIPTSTSIGFLVGLNPLLQFFFIIIIGIILNEKNIKIFLILGYLISTIIVIGYIVSFDFWSFFLVQIMLAIGFSMFWIATIVYIAQNSNPTNKGRLMGYATTSIYAGTTSGGLFFSLLLAVFQNNYDLSMSFMILFPAISTIIIIFLFKLPQNKSLSSPKSA
ncbi:MAG: MFS transporter [Candidatus Thorarchaeota archaeon]